MKAPNVVDSASSFQRVISFFETETANVHHKLLTDRWTSWAWGGSPKAIALGPAKTNLGDPMVVPAELQGTHIRPSTLATGHGGRFNRVLEKLLDEFPPSAKEEWLECVAHCHVKNQQLQAHGFPPYQFVFGRNPHIPQDLLNQPLQVAPATASLADESIARAQALRTTARTALIQMQYDRALTIVLCLQDPELP